LEDALQKDIRTGFTVFPPCIFNLDMTPSADTWNEYHGGWGYLTQVGGIMPGSADQRITGIAELFGNFPNLVYQEFIKWGMLYFPDLLDPGRAAPFGSDFSETVVQFFPGPIRQWVIPRAEINGKMDLTGNDVSGNILFCQFQTSFKGPVGNKNIVTPVPQQVFDGEFRHFTGTNQKGCFPLKTAENFFSKFLKSKALLLPCA